MEEETEVIRSLITVLAISYHALMPDNSDKINHLIYSLDELHYPISNNWLCVAIYVH